MTLNSMLLTFIPYSQWYYLLNASVLRTMLAALPRLALRSTISEKVYIIGSILQ